MNIGRFKPRANSRRASAFAVAVSLVAMAGCLSRPVSTESPTTKTNFTSTLRTTVVDKVDLLFMIDNSASMGDKQEYLINAIPDLITRLVTPNCVDANGTPIKDGDTVVTTSDGTCATGKAEFAPVHDMHIAVVSSSLGSRTSLTGGEQGSGAVCDPSQGLRLDDRGELVNRSGQNQLGPIATLEPSSFLNWFPAVKANQGKAASTGAIPVSDPAVLQGAFSDLVSGVEQDGCGIESQLESWYRFLIQPDPYDHIDTTSGVAVWKGIDAKILQQRHDFLRPDSLVAIIALTDENDSEVDVRSFKGTAWHFLSTKFFPPRGTSACATNPADPSCVTCREGSSDPNCLLGAYCPDGTNNAACVLGPDGKSTKHPDDLYDWGYDPNLRHVHMKQKYGAVPQFPLSRYSTGLSSPSVPNRDGEYPPGAGSYVGNAGCTNPLFAASLPDGSVTDPATLCNLPPGNARTSDLVFYAHIGGVPWQLLHFDPNNPKNSVLQASDWVKILGNNPDSYDYTGIDPHMIESQTPRPGLAPANSANTTDVIHGREWDTINPRNGAHQLPVDRQFACTFDLAQPKDCTKANASCDCPRTPDALTHDQTPPVCDDNNPTSQVRAKAYPTIRELQLAKLMDTQGIVSSICPIHVTEASKGDPLYGYRPAVATIIDRLKNALTNQCVPRKLTPNAAGEVPCLLLETLPSPAMDCTGPGLGPTDPEILAKFREQQRQNYHPFDGGGGVDPTTLPVCTVHPLTVPAGQTCANDTKRAGWCYTVGVGDCAHNIVFSAAGNPVSGAVVSLQCIETN